MPLPATGQVGSQVLDGPPPSPQMAGAGPTGAPSSFAGMAPPIPTQAMAPELLQGGMALASKIGDSLDQLAQTFPDASQDFGQVKDALMSAMAKLVAGGAPPLSPNATGPQFPGGGVDRGIAGGGTV